MILGELFGDQTIDPEVILRAVDIQIQAVAEIVIVIDRDNTAVDERSGSRRADQPWGNASGEPATAGAAILMPMGDESMLQATYGKTINGYLDPVQTAFL